MSRILVFAISVAALAACRHDPTPEEALRAYRRALLRGDASELRALSAAALREQWSEAQLERWIRKNPRLLEEADERATVDDGQLQVEATVTRDGERLRLVREPDGWKVAEGGLLLARFDTPEAALQTFFFAATGHLGLLRKLIPEAAAARYASDYALGQHLYAERDRIFRARDELGPITEGMASIEGDRAFIPYGEGKTVELVFELDRWRVVDVE